MDEALKRAPNTELGDINTNLEKSLCIYKELCDRLNRSLSRLGYLQSRTKEASSSDVPAGSTADLPQVHKLSLFSDNLIVVNDYLQYLIENLERMV
jgi:hypothetical protein